MKALVVYGSKTGNTEKTTFAIRSCVISQVVGISAVMMTSRLSMPEVVKGLRVKNPKVRIMIGGAPVNPEAAEKYGADGYAKGAGTAVDEAIKLLKMLKQDELKKQCL